MKQLVMVIIMLSRLSLRWSLAEPKLSILLHLQGTHLQDSSPLLQERRNCGWFFQPLCFMAEPWSLWALHAKFCCSFAVFHICTKTYWVQEELCAAASSHGHRNLSKALMLKTARYLWLTIQYTYICKQYWPESSKSILELKLFLLASRKGVSGYSPVIAMP